MYKAQDKKLKKAIDHLFNQIYNLGMLKKIYVLAALIITSIVLFTYLSSEFYAVQYGTATGDSICSLNASFNCEAVAASKYASMFGGVPNAILGLMLSIVMLIALLGFVVSEDKDEWKEFFGGLATLNLAASIFMGIIAFTVMNVYCLFCIALYFISAMIFGVFFFLFDYRPALPKHIFKSNVFLGLLFVVPAFGFLSHKLIKNEYSPAAQEKQVVEAVKSWDRKPVMNFEGKEPLFTLNPGGTVKIAEFADFLCPHCSTASKSIKSFLSMHPDVEFSFYAYPLDPNCNKNFESKQKGPGYACTLAAGVLCAQKQGQGVSLHTDIFENQNYYKKVAMKDGNDGLTSQMLSAFKDIDETAFKECLASEDTNIALIESAKFGKEVNVQGTPTVFMNSRKLNGGASYLVLKAAHEKAL